MGYIVDQYNYKGASYTDTTLFMTPYDGAIEVSRSQNTSTETDISFTNEQLKATFEKNVTYYFHGKIKEFTGGSDTSQTFNVYLKGSTSTTSYEQFVKKVYVPAGNGWFDFYLIFTPLENMDSLDFELTRRATDYSGSPRFATILYEELSIVNNIISTMIGNDTITSLKKIGVQSHPNLIMCINQEEIHIGRTGIYELKTDSILITGFSVVSAGLEVTAAGTPRNLTNIVTGSGGGINPSGQYTLDQLLEAMNATTASASANQSVSIIKSPKRRITDSFSVDYICRSAE